MLKLFIFFVVEFPAVLLNASDGEIESEFHMYVQPQEYPILSEFCTNLTGIKQVRCYMLVLQPVRPFLHILNWCQWVGHCLLNLRMPSEPHAAPVERYFLSFVQIQVDEGVPLHICLSQFSKWIQKIQEEKKIVFHSTPPSCAAAEGKLCTFVTWSGNALRFSFGI